VVRAADALIWLRQAVPTLLELIEPSLPSTSRSVPEEPHTWFKSR
jgi:hypothetical protein